MTWKKAKVRDAIISILKDGPLSTSEITERLGKTNPDHMRVLLSFHVNNGTLKRCGYKPTKTSIGHGQQTLWGIVERNE